MDTIENIFRVNESFIFTIFGASGDLAKLKIFPAIFALAEQKRFKKNYAIIGYARSKKTTEEFRTTFEQSIKIAHNSKLSTYQEKILSELLQNVHYISGQYDQLSDFRHYRKFIDKLKLEKPIEISYFSVPPSVFAPIVENLAGIKNENEIRLILEKPFGTDECSARELFHFIARFFDEEHVYLLDHYLGKKAVRSILPLRHVNRILNLMLKGKEIANIQISAFEDFGVEDRIGYFDQSGTIKDMIQSHLLQILALVTMSIPIEKKAKNIQNEKSAILSSLHFEPKKTNISLGQYANYCSDHEACKLSKTETFAALKFFINRESWFNVPIFLRTGKNLHEKHTFLTIELKKFPFQKASDQPNRVIIELFPDEKIHIKLLDEDGVTSQNEEITTSDSLACTGDYCLPPHSLLFLDVIRGNKKHFVSFNEILASWHFIDRVIEFIKNENVPVEVYKIGSAGPKSQNILTEKAAFKWYNLYK